MTTKRTTRHSCNYTASNALVEHSDYSTWTHRMGLVLCAMYLLLAVGSVVFGW